MLTKIVRIYFSFHFYYIIFYDKLEIEIKMIEINEIFSDSDKRLALWCSNVVDTNDLAGMADDIIKNDIHLVSVPHDIVNLMWVYLEKSDVKILTRFIFEPRQKGLDSAVYDLAADIKNVCKKGANGVQIFIRMSDFESFIEKISVVRDDLFFAHDLYPIMDIQDIDVNNWQGIFQKLQDVRAKALVLTLREDMKNRSDFVGRVYGMLQQWNTDTELHFVLNNNFDRMEQVIRLVESEKPEFRDKLRFFLDY